MLREAIDYYNGLFDDASAAENQQALDASQRRENLFFGERPLCTVLRPRLLTTSQYEYLRETCGVVARTGRQAVDYAFKHKPTWELMAFTPGEEALLAIDPGYSEQSATSRLDSFFDPDQDSLQFVEYNAESPAAIAYEDVLSQVFLDLPVIKEFGKRYPVSAIPARHKMLETLLGAFREWGRSDDPRIAILDWKGLPTHSEFLLFQNYFREQGHDAIICAPEDLTYRDGTLYADGAPINLVYKRLLTSEALEMFGATALDHPLMRAYADGAICLVNSFRAKPLHKKMIFGLLSDPEIMTAAGISQEDQQRLKLHIPWTRRVQHNRTTYQGQEVDLIPFMIEQRDRLLLKPNDDYGGKGITIGWETEAEDWQRAVEAALKEPFVVQERVHIAYEDFPAYRDGALHIGRRLVDTDPFLFGTHSEGCLTRLSTVTLLNVTAGGGSTVPTLLIDQAS